MCNVYMTDKLLTLIHSIAINLCDFPYHINCIYAKFKFHVGENCVLETKFGSII